MLPGREVTVHMHDVRNIYATLPMYLYIFWPATEYSDMEDGAVDLVSSVAEIRVGDLVIPAFRTTVSMYCN